MTHNHGLDRVADADWLYEPHRDDLDDMALSTISSDMERLAREKRYVSAFDRELLEGIEKFARIILEGGTQ